MLVQYRPSPVVHCPAGALAAPRGVDPQLVDSAMVGAVVTAPEGWGRVAAVSNPRRARVAVAEVARVAGAAGLVEATEEVTVGGAMGARVVHREAVVHLVGVGCTRRVGRVKVVEALQEVVVMVPVGWEKAAEAGSVLGSGVAEGVARVAAKPADLVG